ncbi:menaquinone biosynthesis decarboxylase [Collibacillus ludicampi]|jgi:4-hydroxy-3-polyprenylbenzoate decarboxylase|uniref:Menaquinone biosynthesis decarboxylase n=1 Tax=Collibacillus ludicampi TaxID=2771369 RepID=A0AAV4LKB3_9BACL|nr:menaquinone biosynthesis decarboxylase [Collibacillus ludicampi]GIM48195.1 menaquinone biosynthesis decarboxylase [Collibacillus ludicampi]
MAYKDLRHFIEVLEKKGLLVRVREEVDPVYEITEITDRVTKKFGPALLFENVKGFDIPVLINTFGSYERMNLALEVHSLDEIGEQVKELIQPPTPASFLDKLKALPKLAELSSFLPKMVKHAPCQEVVITDEPSLDMLPILKCWPDDGGKFITMPLVFSKDPETGKRNCGMYRMHVFDGKTTGMHWHKHKDGAHHFDKLKKSGKKGRMEVAVAIGADPAVVYSATAPLPPVIDEMMFAGFLRKAPVEMVKCKTVDIEVPAHAEIVLEGYVDLDELRMEGPFGDHTGYYSLADLYPVFHLTAITHRKNPIYMTTIVGIPPQEDAFLGKATERIFLPLLRTIVPEVVDMNMPLEGVFHNCVILSIKKRYPWQAKKVMHAVWGTGQMMFTKLIIVVDEDVDVHNLSEVAWRVFNNIDAKRDITIVEGPVDALDHASPMPLIGTKMGIDATKKWPSEGHHREWPNDIVMSEEIKRLVDEKWHRYGINV